MYINIFAYMRTHTHIYIYVYIYIYIYYMYILYRHIYIYIYIIIIYTYIIIYIHKWIISAYICWYLDPPFLPSWRKSRYAEPGNEAPCISASMALGLPALLGAFFDGDRIGDFVGNASGKHTNGIITNKKTGVLMDTFESRTEGFTTKIHVEIIQDVTIK